VDNIFVIGDVHGHLDRLEALLKQEGLLVWCDTCEGGGTMDYGMADSAGEPLNEWCDDCKGLGQKRVRKDVIVVQLGDLGHWGQNGSPTGDLLCYKYVTENDWCDVVLWGNHDRAMVDGQHAFTGFIPDYQTGHYLSRLHNDGRLQIAFEAHGFLLTHAGLASTFKYQKVDPKYQTDVQAFVDWINDEDDKYLQGDPRSRDMSAMDANAAGIINAIGARRGGSGPTGGILWRDIEEGLYDGFRQIFGHSADHKKGKVRMCSKNAHTRLDPNDNTHEAFAQMVGVAFAANMKPSYCIDVGGKHGSGHDCLAGIWLPSEQIVRVDL
jgi:hypothetical protein